MPPLLVAAAVAAVPLIINAVDDAGDDDDENPNRVGARPVGDIAREMGIDAPSKDAENESRYLSEQARYGMDPVTNNAETKQSRSEQVKALGLMEQGATGNGPSAAQAMLQQGMDESMLQNRSLAASARGGGANAAAAMRAALVNNSRAGVAGAQNASMLRANEMNAARQGYMQGSGMLRSGDFNSSNLRSQRELTYAQQSRLNRQDQYNNAMGMAQYDLARRSGNANFQQQAKANDRAATGAALNSAGQMATTGYAIAKAEQDDGGMPKATTTGSNGKVGAIG